MTRDAYDALANCARRRIETEWSCTAAERAVLSLVNELSFALGQSLALVPCLNDFAAVIGVHKSTVSRAIRSALKKGYLEIVQRRDETLYAVCTETPGAAAAEDQDDAREQARKRLVVINETRLQGQADANGQQRLPGILENEERHAPARAFAAMLEEPTTATAAQGPEQQTRPELQISTPNLQQSNAPEGELESRLEKLSQTMEAAREGTYPPQPTQRPGTQARGPSVARQDEWGEITRGLTGEALYALELTRDECVLGGQSAESDFWKWLKKWRLRAVEHPRVLAESAGVCKAMRLEGRKPAIPGAFIYRSYQAALNLTG